MPSLEEEAREDIDRLLTQAGWVVQDKNAVNLSASRGVAVRELSFKTGELDYTLFVDGKAIGTVEAKPSGHSLTGVEEQSEKYVKGVPSGMPAWRSRQASALNPTISTMPPLASAAERAFLRPQAGARKAVNGETLDLRPQNQQAFHAERKPIEAV